MAEDKNGIWNDKLPTHQLKITFKHKNFVGNSFFNVLLKINISVYSMLYMIGSQNNPY